MSLQIARSNLRSKLLTDTAFEPQEQRDTLELIDKWWFQYKEWEERDTFVGAFKEGRMTIRQGPHSQTYGWYQGRHSGTDFVAEKQVYEKERYRTGVDSIKERLNPDNLATLETGERMKYTHGLHDLSASLGTPTIPQISKQLRWKNETGKLSDWVTIFMPLAEPEDHGLFILLNLMAKRLKIASPLVYERVRYMSKRMTRLKLAAAEDIGAGLSNHSVTELPKFKYGVKRESDLDFARFKNTLDYTSILPKATTPKPVSQPMPKPTFTSGSIPPPPPPKAADTNTNEIVISYREHKGDRFPVFTQWNGGAFVCLPGEPGSKWFQRERVPDYWQKTVELSR